MKSYVEPSLPNPLISNPLSQTPKDESRRGSVSEEDSYPKRLTEDLGQIGTIFDQNLFERINQVDHIKRTEMQLE
jgi:hypothetical protein